MSQLPVGVVSGLAPGLATAAWRPSDLKIYARLAWRWLWLMVLCALLGGAAAYLVSLNLPPVYQAAGKVLINEARTPTATSYNDILASERVARTYADLLQRQSVLDAAFVRLGRDPALGASQISAVTVSPVRDTQLVALTIEGPNPQLVAAVANTLPAVFVDELRKLQAGRFAASEAGLTQELDAISRQVETTRRQLAELQEQRTAPEELAYTQLGNALTQYQTAYANLLQRYEALRLAETQSTDTIVLIEAAAVPTSPIRPRVLANTLLAAIAGALATLGIVFLIEYLDDRVQTPEDLQRIANVPVLGAIGVTPPASPHPGAGALISVRDPHHPIVEAYRRLRTNLQYYNLDRGLSSLLVTSAETGEGKSITCANLAVVMAQAGVRVILVDADLRQPCLHRLFGVPRRPGLAEMLRDGFSPALLQGAPGVPNLRLLAAGASVPNPAELLGSQRMQQLARQLHGEADILIYDTPPLLAVTDAQVAGHLVDGALLVVNSRKTAAGAVYRALQALAQVNVPVMGAVLNRLGGAGRAYAYYHYYAHDYVPDYVPGDSPAAARRGAQEERGSEPAKVFEPLPAND